MILFLHNTFYTWI